MRTEQDLAEKAAMLAALVDSSDDAIISKNLNGIITSWNRAAERLFGHTEMEAIGKNISLIIPHDKLKEEEMIISTIRLGRRLEHYQTTRINKEGKEFPLSVTVSPILNAEGQIVGASKIARDISKQKEVESIMVQYAQRLELINETGKILSAELDINQILQKTTDATTKLCGAAVGAFFYNKADSKGESLLLYTLSGAPREAFEKFGTPRNTEVFDITFSGKGILRSDDITKDQRYGKNSPHKGMPQGHLPVVSYLAVPVISQSGIVIGGLFFGHPTPAMFTKDHETLVQAIATHAGVALENAKLYHEIQALSARKDEFIGFTSHELKTPLTAIKGYVQLIAQNPEDVSKILPNIDRQVSRLSGIISDLLDLSKIQAGKFDLNLQNVSLGALVKESCESAKQLSAAHTIDCRLPAENIILKIDSDKMVQVLLNIFSNAIKYSSNNKKIILSAERTGDEVKISIHDSGIGIATEHLDKIFNRFYRVNESSNKTQGLGLGLYLCKEFVEGHRGKIWAESEEEKGTTIHILLPIESID